MDKRINEQSQTYFKQFKESVKEKIRELNIQEKDKTIDILEFINEYQNIEFKKDDFLNKKRVKNSIPPLHRCNAKRANGEQCTRKRKDGYEYCGTHVKGIPNGSIQIDENVKNMHKIDVFVQDINGIAYYLDQNNNVYKTEDILSNKENPQIVARYVIKENGIFQIGNFI
jgi:hypothetical protein